MSGNAFCRFNFLPLPILWHGEKVRCRENGLFIVPVLFGVSFVRIKE
jgi:hypothetical protein